MPVPAQYAMFPAINASLNGASAILLVTGRWFIAQKKITAHRACMITALVTSSAFLACYLYYHYHVGSVHFPGTGIWRTVYFTILISHTLLAVTVVPLVLVTLNRALKNRFPQHRAIARWTFPIWLYVSVTGVIVYVMLYQIFGA
jgi:uncharacterized membrane protein YozB (DUF420 family)